MKWPFVRRSKYEQLLIDFKIINDEKDWHLEHNTQLSDENDSYFQEINRLNQDLASELNSHRETKIKLEQAKDLWRKSLDHNDSFLKEIRKLEKDFKDTKDALKIAQEDTRQHKMSLDLADEKEEKIKQYLIKVINYI